MHLHYRTSKGVRPGILDRLAGFTMANEKVWVTSVNLRPEKSENLDNRDVTGLFALLVSTLAGDSPLNLLFPYDVKHVKRLLRKINLESHGVKGGVLAKMAPKDPSRLAEALEATSFTVSHAWANGDAIGIISLSVMLNNLDKCQFLATFEIYDDSMEILSLFLPPDAVSEAMARVQLETNVKIIPE